MDIESVVRYLQRRYHINHHDAEDAAIEAYTIAWQQNKMDDFGWVIGIARHAANAIFRERLHENEKVNRYRTIYLPSTLLRRGDFNNEDIDVKINGQVILADGETSLVPIPLKCGHEPTQGSVQKNGKGEVNAYRCKQCDRERKRIAYVNRRATR